MDGWSPRETWTPLCVCAVSEDGDGCDGGSGCHPDTPSSLLSVSHDAPAEWGPSKVSGVKRQRVCETLDNRHRHGPALQADIQLCVVSCRRMLCVRMVW